MFLAILQNSWENTCARVSILIKLQPNFIKIEALAQVFSCDFCEISKNTFSYRTPPVAVSLYDDTIATDFIANIKNLFICWHKFLEDTTENNFEKSQKFLGKYLWRSSILVKALSLRFTVILLMILKLKVLRNFIIILSALTGNFLFLVTIFLSTFHSIYGTGLYLFYYSIILFYYWIYSITLLFLWRLHKLPKIKRSNYIKSD